MSPQDTPPPDDLDPYVGAIGSTSPQAIQVGQQDRERRRRFNVASDTALDYFSEPTRFQQSPHTGTGDLGIQNYAKEAGDQYEDLIRRRAPEFADQVPQARQKFEAQLFAAQQKAKLDYWRDQYANADETTMGTIRRLAIPGAARVTRIQFEKNAKAADAAIQSGTANEDAYRELAAYARLAQLSEDHPFKEAIYSLPSVVGEYAAGGKVLGALGKVTPGLGWLAPEAAAPTSLLGKGAVALGRGIGLTATVPGAAIEAAASKGSLTDLKNLGPALAHETLQNAVFGSLSEMANLPGGTFTNRLQRIAAKTGAGIAEQQAIDVIGKAAGLQTRYGLMQDILEGKSGDALKNLGVQALTFSALSALHSGDPAKVNKVLQEQLQKSAARGDSAQQTGETFGSVLQAVQATYNEAARQNPNASPAELAKLIAPNLPEIVRQALPTGPRRAEAAEFAKQVLSKSFDIKDAEWEVAASKEPLRLGYRPPEIPTPAPEKPTGGPPAPEPGTGLINPVQTGVPGIVSGAVEVPGKPPPLPDMTPEQLAAWAKYQGLSYGEAQKRQAAAKTAATPQAPETPPGPQTPPEAPAAAPAPAEAPEATPGPAVTHEPPFGPDHPAWAKETPEQKTYRLLTTSKKFPDVGNTAKFREGGNAPFEAVSDVDGMGKLSREEGDRVLRAKIDSLREAGLEPYHGGQDEFLTKADTREELQAKLEDARARLKAKTGADFSYGIAEGGKPADADAALREAKAAKKVELSPITKTSRGELLGRIERGEGNLTPVEQELMKVRLLDATPFRELGEQLGVTYQTVKNWEAEALRKLGHSGTVDELHLASRPGQPTAAKRAGGQVAGEAGLHLTDPHDISDNALVNQLEGYHDELDKLDRKHQKLKEKHGDNIPADKLDKLRAERRRLSDLINQAQDQSGLYGRRLASESGAAPEPAERPGEAPLRPAGGGGLPEGAAPPEAGAAGQGAPAEPGQAAGPAVELPHQAAPVAAAAAPGRPAGGDQLADLARETGIDRARLEEAHAAAQPTAEDIQAANQELRQAGLAPLTPEDIAAAHEQGVAEGARQAAAESGAAPAAGGATPAAGAAEPGTEFPFGANEPGVGEPGRERPAVLKFADKLEADARAALQAKLGGRLFTGFDPTIIPDVAKFVAAKIIKGGYTLAQLTRDAIGRFGETVRPHLQAIWAKATELASLGRDDGQTPTATKNAAAALERQKAGLPPLQTPDALRLASPEVRAEALRRIDEEPAAVDQAVAKARSGGVLDPVENALVLYRQNEARLRYRDALVTLADNRRAGTSTPADVVMEAQAKDALDDITKVAKRAGTAAGQALRFRQMAVNEDFSLAQMALRLEAAQGRPLSDQQKLDLVDSHARIEKAQGQSQAAEEAFEAAGHTKGSEAAASPEFRDLLNKRAAAESEQGSFEKQVASARAANQGWGRWAADTLTKLRVNLLISSPVTLAKLVAAAAQRVLITPIEELAGAAWSQLPGLSKIAAAAPRQGRGLNPAAEGQSFASAFGQGLKDAWQTLRTGQSELDLLYGNKSGEPSGWLDYQFRLHDALKAPAVRAEYTRSFLKRLDAAAQAGQDVTSPAALLRMGSEAYQDAQAAKFRQDNWLVDRYNRFVSGLRQEGQPVASQAAGFVLKQLTPIVRIPTNLAFEVGTHIFGVGTGAIQATRAFARGLEDLAPAEADSIMRQFKKGSLGFGLLLAGYFNPQMFGGYYSGKRDDKDVPAGAARLGGVTVPSWLMHNPALETLQFGASVRRAADKMSQGEKQGLGEGSAEALLGLGREMPLLRETAEVGKGLSPNASERGAFFGELTKSLVVPQFAQWLAGRMDTNAAGEPIQRKPAGVLQHVETGIPGLRQRVPTAEERKKLQAQQRRLQPARIKK